MSNGKEVLINCTNFWHMNCEKKNLVIYYSKKNWPSGLLAFAEMILFGYFWREFESFGETLLLQVHFLPNWWGGKKSEGRPILCQVSFKFRISLSHNCNPLPPVPHPCCHKWALDFPEPKQINFAAPSSIYNPRALTTTVGFVLWINYCVPRTHQLFRVFLSLIKLL